jgi:hypothetical protein
MDKIAIAVALTTVGLWALVVIRMNRASHKAEAISRRLKEVAEQGPVVWRGERDVKPWGDVVEIPAAAKAGGGLGTAAGTLRSMDRTHNRSRF